jgi:hypothetical protein
MMIPIEAGQQFEHESGEVYEALSVSDSNVKFATSHGLFVRMSVVDAEDAVRMGVLTLMEDDDEDDD